MAYITAGAGGMFCGSCLHDNTLARWLIRLGVDVQLIPMYTPIRTDEENVSLDRVFFGGINVFLQQKVPLFRYLPPFLDRFLDQPALLRWVASRGLETNAAQLGSLTVSMLRGSAGFQRKEARRLCRWLAGTSHPQLINLSNMLIAGCIPEMKRRLAAPVIVTLQGDDVFLESLIEPYRSQAFVQLRQLVQQVDGFIVYSQYYVDFMHEYLGIPRERIHVIPLGLDTDDYRPFLERSDSSRTAPTIGYLARLAPEKGLHVLVEAFLRLRRMAGTQDARLRVAGWLGLDQREYAQQQFQRMSDISSPGFEYVGTVSRQQKLAFLGSLDVLSVPTVYREPKGLFVLEALAAGVPVVQPSHGAFPEMLAELGGGQLVDPDNPESLAAALHGLLTDRPLRLRLAAAGQRAVHESRHARAMAEATRRLYTRFVSPADRVTG